MDPAPGPKRYEPARLAEGEVLVPDIVVGEEYELEIGGGRGGFALERLTAAPRNALVGFEVKKKWASKVDEKLAQLGFAARGRVYGEDANAVMPRLRPDAVFARVFLHFPDPWWKKRHEKRLVMGDPFLRQVHRLLVDRGELFIQTDVEDRAEQYLRFVTDFGAGFEPAGDVPGNPAILENPYSARSPREHRAMADGLPIWRMRWVKK